MFRKSAISSTLLRYRPSRAFVPQVAFVSFQSNIHTTSTSKKTATEVVKENLEKLNKKIGKVAAEGIEKTQEASHKAGEMAARTSQKAEEVLGHAEEKANETKANINDVAETTKDKAKETAETTKEKAKETAETAKYKANAAADGVKKKVNETT